MLTNRFSQQGSQRCYCFFSVENLVEKLCGPTALTHELCLKAKVQNRLSLLCDLDKATPNPIVYEINRRLRSEMRPILNIFKNESHGAGH